MLLLLLLLLLAPRHATTSDEDDKARTVSQKTAASHAGASHRMNRPLLFGADLRVAPGNDVSLLHNQVDSSTSTDQQANPTNADPGDGDGDDAAPTSRQADKHCEFADVLEQAASHNQASNPVRILKRTKSSSPAEAAPQVVLKIPSMHSFVKSRSLLDSASARESFRGGDQSVLVQRDEGDDHTDLKDQSTASTPTAGGAGQQSDDCPLKPNPDPDPEMADEDGDEAEPAQVQQAAASHTTTEPNTDSNMDHDSEESWDADSAPHAVELGLWVPPHEQHRYITVDLRMSAQGKLGLVLRYHPIKRKKSGSSPRRMSHPARSPTRQCSAKTHRRSTGSQDNILVNSGVQLHGLDQSQNPHARELDGVVPLGSVLQMVDGELVTSPTHAHELADDLWWRQQTRQAHLESVQPGLGDQIQTKVRLVFALPPRRSSSSRAQEPACQPHSLETQSSPSPLQRVGKHEADGTSDTPTPEEMPANASRERRVRDASSEVQGDSEPRGASPIAVATQLDERGSHGGGGGGGGGGDGDGTGKNS